MRNSLGRLILLGVLVATAILSLPLLVKAVLLLPHIWGQVDNAGETLSQLEVTVSCLSLIITFLGFVAIFQQLRTLMSRPKLTVFFNKTGTLPSYRIEIGLLNRSNKNVDHFRLLLQCCTPQITTGRKGSVEIIPSRGVSGLTIETSLDHDTLEHLLPYHPPQGYRTVSTWQGRTSRIHIYPNDRLRVATIVASSEIHLAWRLDSEGEPQEGNEIFAPD